MNKKIIQILDNGEGLFEIPGDFLFEPMYYKQGLTDDSSMKLREGIIEKLLHAKKHLPKGWNFKIWDGYRALDVQDRLYKELWRVRAEENPDWDEPALKEAVEKFVAFPSFDPLAPSPHNTGGAVDLTIVDRGGNELDMGTYFDEFHERSYGDYFETGTHEPGAEDFQKNRNLLREILAEEDFAPYQWEWWHFSFGNQDWALDKAKSVAIYGSLEL
jgi:zinc D-Ala-D-Ala dipeptidase